jgi:hypothetical protein
MLCPAIGYVYPSVSNYLETDTEEQRGFGFGLPIPSRPHFLHDSFTPDRASFCVKDSSFRAGMLGS